MACSFEGTWKEGDFATGDWVLRDGTTYKGSFQGGKPVVRLRLSFLRDAARLLARRL